MEICSLDWELASKFVPLITAITSIFIAVFVFWAWHYQKGKEVIASECKAYWTSLTELEIIYNNLEQNADFRSNNFQQFSKDIESWKAINLPKISLIKKLTNEDSKFIDSTNKLIARYNSDKFLNGLHRFQGDSSAYELVNRTQVLNISNEIKESLLPYIKYKFR